MTLEQFIQIVFGLVILWAYVSILTKTCSKIYFNCKLEYHDTYFKKYNFSPQPGTNLYGTKE